MSASTLPPGLMVIHGNQPEALRELLVQWLQRYPLAPLETERILVQSNGIAQWLKLSLAADRGAVAQAGLGIAAGLKIELPAQFLWQAYRAVLGTQAVPEVSALDKAPLAWRLMRLLPALLDDARFAPLRRFLADDGDLRRRYQLSERLADLLDQYQVYRADWLADWAEGRDQLRLAHGGVRPLDTDQVWQAELWRQLLADVGAEGMQASRSGVHQRFMQRLAADADAAPAGVPRRVIVFGISSMPAQTFEALAALARFSQVLLCVHNPCQHHWADIVADKDLLRHAFRRHTRRPGSPADLDAERLHQHAQPLLAAWGKQGRDYINLLDQQDDPASYRERFAALNGGRIDLFSRPQTSHLLGQLQDDILDLRPLAETRQTWPAVDVASDVSLRFHQSHSAQREVEVLHDQLLARLQADPSLNPRDIIVMVPDINQYAPHIDAVFGQIGRDDPRHIPYTIADQGQRGRAPLLVALERLLRLPESRFASSDILDLLDIGAVRQRLGLAEADLPLLRRWIADAGVRWGLDGRQRESLQLPAAAEANSWLFGLRRMLLGYAAGDGAPLNGIEPYAEPAGLEAAALGPLALLLKRLSAASVALTESLAPPAWASRLRQLLDDFLLPGNDAEELLRQQLLDLLDQWLACCVCADFDQPVPLAVVRESWLGAIDQGGLNQRFMAGAVNFCTLLPMRAIPFRMICLLGMNDGDYPRQQIGMDFDLMQGDYRPGDRSRREDDRYLLLEALLSARDQLYVSWVGRNIRDNSERPPSVLVGQLRDHLAAGWRLAPPGRGTELLAALTTTHPLQPFSARYFGAGGEAVAAGIDGLYTYAHEWRAAAGAAAREEAGLSVPAAREPQSSLPPLRPDAPLRLRDLADFLVNPVQAFLSRRLRARLGLEQAVAMDDEAFRLDGLQTWQLQNLLCERLWPWVEQHAPDPATTDTALALAAQLQAELQRLQREGRLPLAAFGEFAALQLGEPLLQLLERYRLHLAQWSQLLAAPLDISRSVPLPEADAAGAEPPLRLEDMLDGVRLDGEARPVLLELVSGRLHEGPQLKWPQLLRHWVRHLGLQLATEGTVGASTLLVSQSGDVLFRPMPAAQAGALLDDLLLAWHAGMRQPLPVACRAALAWLNARTAHPTQAQGHDQTKDEEGAAAAAAADRALREAERVYEGGFGADGEVQRSAALARSYPNWAQLYGAGPFEAWAERLYGPMLTWLQAKSSAGDEE